MFQLIVEEGSGVAQICQVGGTKANGVFIAQEGELLIHYL